MSQNTTTFQIRPFYAYSTKPKTFTGFYHIRLIVLVFILLSVAKLNFIEQVHAAEIYTPSYKSYSYDALKEEARGLIRKGIYQEAIIAYSEAIRLKPNDPSAYSGRALSYCLIDRANKAVDDFGEAIKLSSNAPNSIYYLGRGIAELRLGNTGTEDFDNLIRLEPNKSMGYYFRGYLYYLQGNKEKANQDGKKANELRKFSDAISYDYYNDLGMGKAYMSFNVFDTFIRQILALAGVNPPDTQTSISFVVRYFDKLIVKEVNVSKKMFIVTHNDSNILLYVDDNEVISDLKKIRVGDEIGVQYQAKSDWTNLAIALRNIKDRNNDSNSSRPLKAIQELDLGDFRFVIDKEYLGDKILSVIDRHFPNAVFLSDETISFTFRGEKYLLQTKKVNNTGQAYYRIKSISIIKSSSGSELHGSSPSYSSEGKESDKDEIRRKRDALQPALMEYCRQGNNEACRQVKDWESLRKY